MLDSQIPRRRPVPDSAVLAAHAPYSHSRTRTTSSGIFPMQVQHQQHPQSAGMYLGQPQQYGHQRRSPSVNTFASVSSGGAERGPAPNAYRNSPPSNEIRRSTSSRSNGSTQPLSYVALLRKQKATVWCDRAQPEDPYMLAKQKQAKMRALQTVGSGTPGSGSTTAGRTSTGLSSAGGKMVGKIRHHNKAAVVGYSPDSNYVGVGGVPLRLSATEVEGEDSDDDMASQKLHHRRTGSSGRSSTSGSIQGRRGLNYRSSAGSGLQMTGGGSQNSRRWTGSNGENTPERRGSLADGGSAMSDKRASDAASGSSQERADDVPDLTGAAARLASNSLMNATLTREKSVKNPEELRRRGSVDERTMTLTSGRLFIANPD